MNPAIPSRQVPGPLRACEDKNRARAGVAKGRGQGAARRDIEQELQPVVNAAACEVLLQLYPGARGIFTPGK